MIDEFRQAILAIIVNDRGNILIGSSPRDGGYNFPQGGIDEGEIPRNTVFRELKEELNLDLEDTDILFESSEKVSYLNPPEKYYVGQKMIVFKIKFRENMVLSPQDNEFEELLWINPIDLDNYDTMHRFPAYKNALKLCNLL
jgi:putative (di)nucleoside polyphosphate hydrolase